MTDIRTRDLLFAIGIAFLAGFVDALGYLDLGGFFVAFMSGNSTRLSVAVAQGELAVAVVPAVVILSFVSGVVTGALVGDVTQQWRKPTVMSVVAIFLLLSSALHPLHGSLAICLVAAAMGASNTIFATDGSTSIPLTYMTGTLVKLGQSLARVLSGASGGGLARYFSFWLALVLGAVIGTWAYSHVGFFAMWYATAAAALLALLLFLHALGSVLVRAE